VKKFLALFCVFVLFAGFAAAEGIGLSVGADFDFYNVNKADGDDWNPVLMPWVTFDKSFGGLDLSTELDYYFDLQPDFDNLSQYVDFDLCLTYNLSFGSASTLTLEADNLIETFTTFPRDGNGTGTLPPRVRFTQETDIGSFYAQAAAPIGYLDGSGVLLRSRLAWISTFGLTLWGQLDSSLVDPTEIYQGWRAYAGYSADSFSVDATVRGWADSGRGLRIYPINLKVFFGDATFYAIGWVEGVAAKDGYNYINVTPGIEYALGNLSFYAECEFADVTSKSGDMSISPGVGVSFSF